MGDDPPTIIRAGREGEIGIGQQPDKAPPPPKPGDRLEFFELLSPIGEGGMGAVFLAVDGRLQREVALKVLPPELSSDPEAVQRFYQEARAAARLDHENIARVYSIGSDKGHHYIAFEFIEGDTLRQKIVESGRLSVSEAVSYTLQIAAALDHSSSRGVIHRDVKPSNIIVTPQGRAKLVDMGLARRFERGGDDGLTQSGMTLGTFDYISPEQALDPRDVDVRSDLYSLGCTLFHMLAGQPPFPDGTALQKLRKHEKDTPPDILALNPAVPPDLAAILARLMAKERDRRYQQPEALIRDLMTMAGALGLRSIGPEGLVWMAPQAPPAWERHLVWGLPAAALIGVVGFLIWWGQPPSGTSAEVKEAPALAATNPPIVAQAKSAPIVRPVTSNESSGKDQAEAKASPRIASPKEVVLRAEDSLSAAIAREPSGSTLILSDDGPYNLTPAVSRNASRRDLTIRAAPGAHPVLRPTRSTSTVEPTAEPSLLAFGPGVIVVEGIEFQLDGGDESLIWNAVRADRTDLELRRCSFRISSTGPSLRGATAVHLTAVLANSERLGTVLADACHFDGGLVALHSKGPGEIRVRDCTFGSDGPAFWFDNAGSMEPIDAELILRHASARLARGPFIRANRTRLRASVEDSVIATTRETTATLIETDEPELVTWRGKANLYSGIETYLRASRDLLGRSSIEGFDRWADDPRADREALSRTEVPSVWESADSPTGVKRSDPSSSFALSTPDRPTPEVGARRGPRGRIVSLDEGLASLLGSDGLQSTRKAGTNAAVSTRPDEKLAANPGSSDEKATETIQPMPGPPRVEDANETKLATAPVPALDGPLQPMNPENQAGNAPMERATDTQSLPSGPPKETRTPKVADIPVESNSIRSASAFTAALEKLSSKGGTISLSADADIELPEWRHAGPGRILLRAEDGTKRPILRFRPGRNALIRSAGGPAFLTLSMGRVEVSGIDVVLEAPFEPEGGDWAAFRVAPGADLTLTRSTITVEGNKAGASLVFVSPVDDARPVGAGSALPAGIHVTDSLLRCQGDVIRVAPGCRIDAEFTNVVVGSEGSLVHARGQARGERPDPLKLVLRQVSARLIGGLAFLESGPEDPELPQIEVLARDVVVATDGDDSPLFRVDGQSDLDSLRDRIKWDGQGVQYHRISVYRRDQTSRPGTMPQRFDRPSWDLAVAPMDTSSFHGDVRFLKPWAADRSPVTITGEDLKLDPDGPSSTSGPDLKRIPPAPGVAIKN